MALINQQDEVCLKKHVNAQKLETSNSNPITPSKKSDDSQLK